VRHQHPFTTLSYSSPTHVEDSTIVPVGDPSAAPSTGSGADLSMDPSENPTVYPAEDPSAEPGIYPGGEPATTPARGPGAKLSSTGRGDDRSMSPTLAPVGDPCACSRGWAVGGCWSWAGGGGGQ